MELSQERDAAPPLRVGVIGCGYWGQKLVRNFNEAPGSLVTSVCDLEPERLSAARKRQPALSVETDYRQVLCDPGIDAVCISTPASSHYALARDALDAGKHVWVEKPMSLRYEEARDLIERAEQQGRVLLVDHTYIYAPAVQRMRTTIDAGEFGEALYYDSVRVNREGFCDDVNVVWDLGPHDLSLVDYLMPCKPTGIAAVAASNVNERSGSEGQAYVTVSFAEDCIAHFRLSWLAPAKQRQTTLCGTKLMLVFDDMAEDDKLKTYERGIAIGGDDANLAVTRKLPQTEPLQIAARHFIDCIATNTTPVTDGTSGARVVAMLEAAQRSLATGGRMERIDF